MSAAGEIVVLLSLADGPKRFAFTSVVRELERQGLARRCVDDDRWELTNEGQARVDVIRGQGAPAAARTSSR